MNFLYMTDYKAPIAPYISYPQCKSNLSFVNIPFIPTCVIERGLEMTAIALEICYTCMRAREYGTWISGDKWSNGVMASRSKGHLLLVKDGYSEFWIYITSEMMKYKSVTKTRPKKKIEVSKSITWLSALHIGPAGMASKYYMMEKPCIDTQLDG